MQETRRSILEILKTKGEATVEELAEVLGLTPMTVRHHLALLQKEGLISSRSIRRAVGRPHHSFFLSEKGQDFFPKRYDRLANRLLTQVEEMAGQHQVLQILEGYGRRMLEGYAWRLEDKELEDKVVEVCTILEEEGFPSIWENSPQGYLIHTVHCGIEEVAQRHPEACLWDLTFISQALGVPVQRLCRIVEGKPRCTYLVRAPQKQ